MQTRGHIFSWLVYAIILFSLIWLFDDLFALLIESFLVLWIVWRTKQWSTIIQQGKWMIRFLILFSLIQLVLRHDGQHVLLEWQGTITLFNFDLNLHWRTTMEAINDTTISMIRFLMFWFLFIAIQPLLPTKRLLPFTAQLFPDGTQMIYMTLRLVPVLRERSKHLLDVLQTRGFQPDSNRTWKQSILVRLPLLQALLDESLEGSWHRAEAMIARGYGNHKRTIYAAEQWSWFDLLILLCILFSIFSIWVPELLVALLIPFEIQRAYAQQRRGV